MFQLYKAKVVVLIGAVLLSTAFAGDVKKEESQALEKPVRYMFVQSAHSGSFVPVEGKENLYILILKGVSPQTIAFSDRPERVVGQVPIQKFLDGLSFSRLNPPNAAIEILEGNEDGDVIVVELFDPIYNAANKILHYTVSILEEPNHSYAIFNERHDKSLPEQFGPTALFIDDCADCCYYCCKSDNTTECGCIRVGCCWHWYEPLECKPCRSHLDKCKEIFGAHCGYDCTYR